MIPSCPRIVQCASHVMCSGTYHVIHRYYCRFCFVLPFSCPCETLLELDSLCLADRFPSSSHSSLVFEVGVFARVHVCVSVLTCNARLVRCAFATACPVCHRFSFLSEASAGCGSAAQERQGERLQDMQACCLVRGAASVSSSRAGALCTCVGPISRCRCSSSGQCLRWAQLGFVGLRLCLFGALKRGDARLSCFATQPDPARAWKSSSAFAVCMSRLVGIAHRGRREGGCRAAQQRLNHGGEGARTGQQRRQEIVACTAPLPSGMQSSTRRVYRTAPF